MRQRAHNVTSGGRWPGGPGVCGGGRPRPAVSRLVLPRALRPGSAAAAADAGAVAGQRPVPPAASDASDPPALPVTPPRPPCPPPRGPCRSPLPPPSPSPPSPPLLFGTDDSLVDCSLRPWTEMRNLPFFSPCFTCGGTHVEGPNWTDGETKNKSGRFGWTLFGGGSKVQGRQKTFFLRCWPVFDSVSWATFLTDFSLNVGCETVCTLRGRSGQASSPRGGQTTEESQPTVILREEGQDGV